MKLMNNENILDAPHDNCSLAMRVTVRGFPARQCTALKSAPTRVLVFARISKVRQTFLSPMTRQLPEPGRYRRNIFSLPVSSSVFLTVALSGKRLMLLMFAGSLRR